MNRLPIHVLPRIVYHAILDVYDCTQAPLPLITSSILSAISLSCQGFLNVQVSEKLIMPTSLFFLTIANSGERKTTVDRMVLEPFYQVDAEELKTREIAFNEYLIEKKIWEEQEKALLNEIRKKTKKNEETTDISERLIELNRQKPIKPRSNKCIYNNATPEAVQYGMYMNNSSIGLIADEGANILDRKIISDFSFINSMWDGVDFQVDRKTSESFIIRNGRITLSIMIQKACFESFMKKHGEKARGSGFFARCLPVLIDEKLSTQGHRFIEDTEPRTESISLFHGSILNILDKMPHNKFILLQFDEFAKEEWKYIYNEIEGKLRAGGEFENIKDFASKLANNIARLSALLSFFNEGNSKIKGIYVKSASDICFWYISQAMDIFSYDEYYKEVSLINWLDDQFRKCQCGYIKKNFIRQYGPNFLRKKEILDKVLFNLEREGCIDISHSYNNSIIIYQGNSFYNNKFVSDNFH
ncbi:TPA: DUF3987 domain-containing protein [Proteus mirabilis]